MRIMHRSSFSKLKVAVIGCFLWGIYLFLYHFQIAPWVLEIFFILSALLFLVILKWSEALVIALAILVLLAFRHWENEFLVIGLSLFVVVSGLGAVKFLDAGFEKMKNLLTSENRSFGLLNWTVSVLKYFWTDGDPILRYIKITILVVFSIGIVICTVGPVSIYLRKRHSILVSEASKFLVTGGDEVALKRSSPRSKMEWGSSFRTKEGNISPVASRLKKHVEVLAGKIGERSLFNRKSLNEAGDYIRKEFELYGYKPNRLEFKHQSVYSGNSDEFPLYNIEVVLGRGTSKNNKVLVVGAHYDTVPGTPGADDNASAVSVLLELAFQLKGVDLDKEIRLVAFSCEEPPSFGTRNMGSYHYVQRLKEEKVKIEGMICLEMVGYYNSVSGSQSYPLFLNLFYPNSGDFIALVSNFSSRKFLKKCKDVWRENSRFPMGTAILPPIFSSITLSDHLNFWDVGFKAIMVTDTAFFRNPYYHTIHDTPDKLDYEKMAEVTGALASILKLI